MTRTIAVGALLLSLAGLMAGVVDARRQASKPPSTNEERERMLADGKRIFAERCASCHDERGGKALKSGPPLNERGLSTDVIAQAVSGRLRDRTEDERRAVTLYIVSFMKGKDSGKTAPKS